MPEPKKAQVAIPGATTDKFITIGQRIMGGILARSAQIGALIIFAIVASLVVWGYNQWALGRREQASELLGKALKIYHAELLTEKDTPTGDEEIPRFKTAKERGEAALSALDKLVQEFPSSDATSDSQLSRAGILYDLGRFADAEVAYRKFLEKAPKDEAMVALAREGLGLCAEAQGKADMALSIYKEQTGEFYKDRFLFHQARVLLKKGDKKGAAEVYKEIYTKMTDSPLREEANNRMLALED